MPFEFHIPPTEEERLRRENSEILKKIAECERGPVVAELRDQNRRLKERLAALQPPPPPKPEPPAVELVCERCGVSSPKDCVCGDQFGAAMSVLLVLAAGVALYWYFCSLK